MRDILAVPELSDTTFAFTDISQRNLDMVSQLCQRDIDGSGVPAKLEATLDRRAAIADSDYVICMIRQGGLEAFQLDIDIPLKYGVDQRGRHAERRREGGARSSLLDFCKISRKWQTRGLFELQRDGMNTWACNKYGGSRQWACHGVQGAHWVTDCVERWAKRQDCLGGR
jgi:alpha-galactosidase